MNTVIDYTLANWTVVTCWDAHANVAGFVELSGIRKDVKCKETRELCCSPKEHVVQNVHVVHIEMNVVSI